MPTKQNIPSLRWYRDENAQSIEEPGIQHSFAGGLATVLNHIHPPLDAVWFMGISGFAFRIMVSKVMCPSAMSVFDWTRILPESVEQVGYKCRHIHRLWHEQQWEKERDEEARQAIREAVSSGIPAIVWDVAMCECGLITGCDDDEQIYDILACSGEPGTLPYSKLGHNQIPVLSVIIPGEPNNLDRLTAIRESLEIAVRHAEQQEWMDRPKYQDGLPAYDLWAKLVRNGETSEVSFDFARYYAAHFYGFRCYARDYLKRVTEDFSDLEPAAEAYEEAARHLKNVFLFFSQPDTDTGTGLEETANYILRAGQAEAAGIELLKRHLGMT